MLTTVQDYSSCIECQGPLKQENYIGKFEGPVFIVKGYECPHCGYQSIKRYSQHRKMELQNFDWKKLAAATNMSSC